MNRREFLAAGTAVSIWPAAGRSAAPVDLKAEPVVAQILPDGDGTTAMLGFNGGTPGPELRLRAGDRLSVNLVNGIDEGTAVHWHGLRLVNAMDGVPGLTQPMVQPGTAFAYDFVAPDAGTYWYHSHNRSWEQVARGLYGALIVEETSPPDVDHDITVILDDWRLEETGEMMGGFGNMHDQAHAGRMGNFAKALIGPHAPVRSGQRLRLRLINVATARVFPIEINGVDGRIVALDGMPLPQPAALDSLVLAPAQRVDIIADVVSEDRVEIVFPTRQGPYEMGRIAVQGAVKARGTAIAALPPNRVAAPDRRNEIALELIMTGGAMSPDATRDAIWSLNGQSGMTDVPLHRFSRGETARIRLRNDTRFAHGIHVHGHHFHEINTDGTLGAFRDTSLVAATETRDVLCVFDNPGKWLLHCHMLDHQAAGMKTWIEVV